jgi:hypothetical protein
VGGNVAEFFYLLLLVHLQDIFDSFAQMVQSDLPHLVSLLYYLQEVQGFTYFLHLIAQLPSVLQLTRFGHPAGVIFL